MKGEPFAVAVDGGLLQGRLVGSGEPVLMLHGGPGLSYGYLAPLVDELSDGHQVAAYQQRGLPSSTAGAPYDVATQVADVVAVLDQLGWDAPVVAGHSWGGHLLLHVLAAHPERVSGALVLDTLGAVGDGGEAEFDAEMSRRTPADVVARAAQQDQAAMEGQASEQEMAESLRAFWPAYFADRSRIAPYPDDMAVSVEAYAGTFESLHEKLPGLAARLAGCTVPTLFVHGGGSPMPVTASTDTADVMGPSASVQVVEGTGHFMWLERPGVIRAALAELTRRQAP